MVHHMVGYDLSYRRNAFTTRIDPDGVPSRPLESLFEQAANSVKTQSDGRWLIINKDEIISSNSESTIELTVFVPDGFRARDQVLAAVAQFEEVVMNNTEVILNEGLRSIEEDGPKCEIPACSRKPEWVRRTAFSGNHLFCKMHAEAEEDFGDNSSNNMFWQQIVQVTT
jgi:hypothetical protein